MILFYSDIVSQLMSYVKAMLPILFFFNKNM